MPNFMQDDIKSKTSIDFFEVAYHRPSLKKLTYQDDSVEYTLGYPCEPADHKITSLPVLFDHFFERLRGMVDMLPEEDYNRYGHIMDAMIQDKHRWALELGACLHRCIGRINLVVLNERYHSLWKDFVIEAELESPSGELLEIKKERDALLLEREALKKEIDAYRVGERNHGPATVQEVNYDNQS
ncbi:hypothetical protein [Desulfocicer niacini]